LRTRHLHELSVDGTIQVPERGNIARYLFWQHHPRIIHSMRPETLARQMIPDGVPGSGDIRSRAGHLTGASNVCLAATGSMNKCVAASKTNFEERPGNLSLWRR
jgi:hypothetical protein